MLPGNNSDKQEYLSYYSLYFSKRKEFIQEKYFQVVKPVMLVKKTLAWVLFLIVRYYF